MKYRDPATGQWIHRKLRRQSSNEFKPREFTFSCFHHIPLLSKDRSRQWFVDALQSARSSGEVDLWAWVLMPEHVHLLLAPRRLGVRTNDFVSEIKESVARTALQWLDLHDPAFTERLKVREADRTRRRFWQPGGGYDRDVENDQTLLAMIEYIHANPVRRGLVSIEEDWEWSSARWYAGIRPVKLEMDSTIPLTIDGKRGANGSS